MVLLLSASATVVLVLAFLSGGGGWVRYSFWLLKLIILLFY